MNIGKIIYEDVANGPGCRTTVFVSGCHRHCKGCFNADTWDFNYGHVFMSDELWDILKSVENDHTDGLTVLGGEPLAPENIISVEFLLKTVKTHSPGKTIWLYTGYTWDEVKDMPIMQHIDVLVDGPFIEEQRDLRLQFRGSRNQRIIDVKRTLEAGTVMIWEGLDDRV